jgi:hypothetical protein
LTICGLLCVGVPFLIWVFIQLARNGITFNPSGSGSRGGWGFLSAGAEADHRHVVAAAAGALGAAIKKNKEIKT